MSPRPQEASWGDRARNCLATGSVGPSLVGPWPPRLSFLRDLLVGHPGTCGLSSLGNHPAPEKARLPSSRKPPWIEMGQRPAWAGAAPFLGAGGELVWSGRSQQWRGVSGECWWQEEVGADSSPTTELGQAGSLPLLDAHPPLAALLRAAWGCGELWAEWAQWAGPHSPRLLPPSRGLGSLLAMSAVCLPPGCRGLPGQHQHQHRAGRRLRRKEEGAEVRAEPAAGRGGSHTALSLSLSPCPLRPALGLAKLSVYASGRLGGSFCVLPGPGPRNPPNTHCLLGSLGLRGSRS